MTNPLFDITLIAGGFAHPRPDMLTVPPGNEPPRPPKPSILRRLLKRIAGAPWRAPKSSPPRRRVIADVAMSCPARP